MSSTCTLAPLAAFAATPLGIGILAVVAVALTSLAIYAISRNNKISELKAPKIVVEDGKAMLQVTEEERKYIEANNQNKDKEGNTVKDEYRRDFELEGKSCYITGKIGDGKVAFSNTVFLVIDSLVVNYKGDFKLIDKNKRLETLGLGTEKEDAKELSITFMPSPVVQKPAAEQAQKEGQEKNRQYS